LRGLPQGTYVLSYQYSSSHAAERPSIKKELETKTGDCTTFEINAGVAIRNVPLFAPAKGTLRLIGTGFKSDELLDLRLSSMERDNAIDSNGGLNYICMVPQGFWIAEFFLSGNPAAERDIQIVNEKLTELEIDRTDLQSGSTTTILEGVLRNAAGFPIKGAILSLTSPGQDLRSLIPNITTDAEGRFFLHGLPMGLWSVRVSAINKSDPARHDSEYIFPSEITNKPQRNSIVLCIDLPLGRAGLRLCDRMTGQPLPDKISWTVRARGNVNNRKTIVTGCGSEAEVIGLPEGSIRFLVTASGYEPYESESFFVAQGERSDLGEIQLHLDRSEQN